MKKVLPLVLALAGCKLAAPSTGQVVEPGVARAEFEVRARGTDIVKTTVIFESDANGAPAAGQHPAIVFVQGGFVSTSRYEWQARTLARTGYTVVLPEHPLELAFFAMDTGEAAKQLLLSPPAGSLLEGHVDASKLAVMGHSLGSVVTVKLALEGGFDAAILEAGYPDTADVSKLPTLGIPTLSLAGSSDCSAKLEQVQEGWASLPSPSALVVLDGVTHYQFTDSQAEDDKNCTPGANLEGAHSEIELALQVFLSSALDDGTINEPVLKNIPNATVEVR